MNFIKFLLSILTILPFINAIKIDCQFGEYQNVHTGHEYKCMVKNMNFSSGSTTHVNSASGTHVTINNVIKQDSQVTEVLFYYSDCARMTTIPKGILNVFPNFDFLNLQGCGIESINADDLVEYPKLTKFKLSLSKIQRVPGDFFMHTPNIIFIYFEGNKIDRVGENLLGDLKSLQQAGFYYEPCINRYVTADITELKTALQNLSPDKLSETSTISSPATEDPSCEVGNLDQKICTLERKLEEVKEVLEKLVNAINGEFKNK